MDTFRDVAKKAVDAIASGTALESPSLAGVVDAAKPISAPRAPVTTTADELLPPTPVPAPSSWSNRGSAFLDKWFGGRNSSESASPPQSPKSQKGPGATHNTRARSVAPEQAWMTQRRVWRRRVRISSRFSLTLCRHNSPFLLQTAP